MKNFLKVVAITMLVGFLTACASSGKKTKEEKSSDILPLASSFWFQPGEFTLNPGGHWEISYPSGVELFLHNAKVISKEQASEFERSSMFRLSEIDLNVIVTSNGFYILDFSDEKGDFYVKSHVSESKIIGLVETKGYKITNKSPRLS